MKEIKTPWCKFYKDNKQHQIDQNVCYHYIMERLYYIDKLDY